MTWGWGTNPLLSLPPSTEGQNLASNACLNAISRARVLRDFEKEEACGRCNH
jgi:hypothetical protein